MVAAGPIFLSDQEEEIKEPSGSDGGENSKGKKMAVARKEEVALSYAMMSKKCRVEMCATRGRQGCRWGVPFLVSQIDLIAADYDGFSLAFHIVLAPSWWIIRD
jgi:hypothetical protein